MKREDFAATINDLYLQAKGFSSVANDNGQVDDAETWVGITDSLADIQDALMALS